MPRYFSDATLVDLPVIELTGSPRVMGETFGEICRDEARALYALRLAAAAEYARLEGQRSFSEAQVLVVCASCLPITEAYDPEGYLELAGIARGAGLTLEQAYALQGLTDLRDLLAFGAPPDGQGCSSFVVGADRSASGHLLLGQTWDLATSNVPFVRLVHRRVSGGPETWALTLTGCLSLIGLNSEGIAVGNTNLVTRDVRPGVQYLSVLHRALRATSLAEAVDCIRRAARAAGHYYYVAGPDEVAMGLECSAARSVPFEVRGGTWVHCNHALSPEIAGVEVNAPAISTTHRQRRLESLFKETVGSLEIDDLKRLLADHEGGEDRCLCRHDHEGVSTNAVVILSPSTCEIHACRGQAHLGDWMTRRVGAMPGAR